MKDWKKNKKEIDWKINTKMVNLIRFFYVGVITSMIFTYSFSIITISNINMKIICIVVVTFMYFSGFFIFYYKQILKHPIKIGFSKEGIHFIMKKSEKIVQWENIEKIHLDNKDGYNVWTILQKNGNRELLGFVSKDLINDISVNFNKFSNSK